MASYFLWVFEFRRSCNDFYSSRQLHLDGFSNLLQPGQPNALGRAVHLQRCLFSNGTAGGCPAAANSLALKIEFPGDNDVNCPPSSIEKIHGQLSSRDFQIEAPQVAAPDR